ncbi:efflux RND transporter periplasmic adaptor subunit [Neptunicella marina]|uniref:Efflux RND transporter periplasmic adaptor subunit n=1 Tax=Neptunicella marina TaxID=2125989 RepID=A0A8J6IPR0_9ALTE|nr:efflux RND transporter periplasmic adaptor subunit [Neptunicella marina]MBC3764851.1 efflux RND transporter periplasmic adaptor subunit [Neptunicella marina]
MTQRLRISPLVWAACALLAVVVYLYLPKEQVEEKRQRAASPVSVYQVSQDRFEVIIEALGTAVANEAVTITAQTSDVVEQINFTDGQLVKAGQLLLSLNSREEKARVNELQVNLAEAKRQLNRISNLAKGNAASQQLLDEQQAKVKGLKAQLEVANTKLAELEVRAPFDGRLGIRNVSKGALVRPGDRITTLDDIHQVKVDFSVAEAYLAGVQVGQLIQATSVAYPGQTFDGKIASIDSRIDPITRAIKVRALVDNPDYQLRPGMLLQINIQREVLNTLVVPESAIIPIQDKQYVYVVKDGKTAVQKEVTVGYRKPGWAQISSGLNAGEQVVSEGSLRLSDGAAVSIVTQ